MCYNFMVILQYTIENENFTRVTGNVGSSNAAKFNIIIPLEIYTSAIYAHLKMPHVNNSLYSFIILLFGW